MGLSLSLACALCFFPLSIYLLTSIYLYLSLSLCVCVYVCVCWFAYLLPASAPPGKYNFKSDYHDMQAPQFVQLYGLKVLLAD
jgi:hypothetical protein